MFFSLKFGFFFSVSIQSCPHNTQRFFLLVIVKYFSEKLIQDIKIKKKNKIKIAIYCVQEINSEFSDSPLRLQYYIVITGAAYFFYSFSIPTMSAMKNWLGVSAGLTFTYIIFLLFVLEKDGALTKHGFRI